MLQPSLLQLDREGLVPMSCSMLAPGPFTPGGFLSNFLRQSSNTTRNLYKLDGAVHVKLLRAPWG